MKKGDFNEDSGIESQIEAMNEKERASAAASANFEWIMSLSVPETNDPFAYARRRWCPPFRTLVEASDFASL